MPAQTRRMSIKNIIICTGILLFLAKTGDAQTRYIIKLKNKGDSPYSLTNPLAFLSQKAIDRRAHYQLTMDSTDLPVTPRYVDSIKSAGAVTILNVSRWLNQVAIQTTDANALAKINNLPFVQRVSAIAARLNKNGGRIWDWQEDEGNEGSSRLSGLSGNIYDYGNSAVQVQMHNGAFLHNIGLHGENMIIGMLDGGFYHYLTLSAFDSIRTNGQVLDTWDFVSNEASVDEDHPHGMECLSTISANLPGKFVGTAPKASFYLYRSEDASSEYPIEEHNWVCAAERVDSAGGDVISSSLGYSTFDPPLSGSNHTYADMNGNTTMAATGADLAAKKGLLVIIAAGNEGNTSWHYITTPGDADSVLTVGAVNAAGHAASFTSLGPTSDRRIKPDVASLGVSTTIQLTNNTIGTGNGTSYATPNLAGLVTCLWQGFREASNIQIIDALRAAGSRADHPNDSIGYGIPDMKKAVLYLLKEFAGSSVTINNCSTTLNWNSKDMSAMHYEIERKLPGQNTFHQIAIQSGTGNVFNDHTYTYTDGLSGAQSGTISYRIRQVIDTASNSTSADYIDTTSIQLTVSCPASSNTDSISITPNPVYNEFTLSMNTALSIEKLNIRITDMKGRMMAWIQKTKDNGPVFYSIPVSFLAKGVYVISIYDDKHLLAAKKVVKL